MLIVRPAQLNALSQIKRNEFEKLLIADMKRLYPEALVIEGSDAVERKVRECINSAIRFGISRKCDIGAYVKISLGVGDDLAGSTHYVWALKILENSGKSGTEKIKSILSVFDECDTDI